MGTIRQQIIDLLAEQPCTALEVSVALSIMEKEVYGHLEHIDRTLVRQGKKLAFSPFTCLNCGFVFEGRKRWNRPGRCPKCKQGHIRMAEYRVVPI